MSETPQDVEYEDGIESEKLAYERLVRLRNEAVATNKSICDRSMVVIGVAVAICSCTRLDLTESLTLWPAVCLIISAIAAVVSIVTATLIAMLWDTVTPGKADFLDQWHTVASGPADRAIEQLISDEVASYAKELEIIDGRRLLLNIEIVAAWIQVVAFLVATILLSKVA